MCLYTRSQKIMSSHFGMIITNCLGLVRRSETGKCIQFTLKLIVDYLALLQIIE